MLGFFLKPEHRLPALVIVMGLAIAALIYGIATGVFEHNNREALRAERQAPATVTAP